MDLVKELTKGRWKDLVKEEYWDPWKEKLTATAMEFPKEYRMAR